MMRAPSLLCSLTTTLLTVAAAAAMTSACATQDFDPADPIPKVDGGPPADTNAAETTPRGSEDAGANDGIVDNNGPGGDEDASTGPNCTNTCPEVGSLSCTLGVVQACEESSLGCLEWAESETCASGYCASETECGTCEHECQAEESICADGQRQVCQPDQAGCLVWSEPSACGAGGCADEQDCLGCNNNCPDEAATSCVLGETKSCVMQPDGCFDWGEPVACSEGFCADDGGCGSCANVCDTPGEKRCTGGTQRTCVADQNGCLDWSEPVDCAEGFCAADGQSCGTCNNQCSPQAKTCANGQLRTCQADVNGCWDWSAPTACADGFCQSSTSCGSCNDECTSETQQKCSAGGLQECTRDAQGCFAWSAPTPCSEGFCQNSTTCGSCNNECSAEGQKRCQDGSLQVCEEDINDCRSWSSPQACGDSFCSNGTTCGTKPSITLHPRDRTVNVGQNATFSVSASGSAPLTYAWRQNGNPIGSNSDSVSLQNVKLSNDGDQIDVLVSNAGGSVASTVAILHVEDVAPNAPSNLAASKNGYSSISLTWKDNSNNETAFQLERSTQPSSGFTQIVETISNAVSYVDNNLNWGQTYYYRIRATNSAGASDYFGPISGTPWQCGDSFTDTRGGTSTTYASVSIDGQCWMKENLRYTGTGATYCYDDDTANCNRFGTMYHRSVAAQACPTDWRLPGTSDWGTLLNYANTLDPSSSGGVRALMDVAGAPNFYNATNATNFSALPGGYYYWYVSYHMYSGIEWEISFWADNPGTTNWPVLFISGDGPYASVIENSTSYGCQQCRAYIRCLKQ